MSEIQLVSEAAEQPVEPIVEDDLAGMAGVFNGLALAFPLYLLLFALWWFW